MGAGRYISLSTSTLLHLLQMASVSLFLVWLPCSSSTLGKRLLKYEVKLLLQIGYHGALLELIMLRLHQACQCFFSSRVLILFNGRAGFSLDAGAGGRLDCKQSCRGTTALTSYLISCKQSSML